MKNSIEINGKVYIPSSRAAEMFKYSNDYIGQLCRGGKVPARMIGRSWFVDRDALLLHKKNTEESFRARCRQSVYRNQQNFPKASNSPSVILKEGTSAKDEAIEKEIEKIASPYVESPLVYSSDERPSLPEIKKEKELAVSPVLTVITKKTPEHAGRRVPINAVYQQNEPLTPAYAGVSRLESIPSSVSYYEVARPIILERVLKLTTVMAIAAILFSGTVSISKNGALETTGTGAIAGRTELNSASVSSAIAGIFDSIIDLAGRTLALFRPGADDSSPIARSDSGAGQSASQGGQNAGGQNGREQVPQYGMVVVPSTGDNDAQEARIRGYFSDQVIVNPDADGMAGTITPVFKQRTGDEYLYVLVPIENI